MNINRLKKSIKKHEGLRLKPYKCTAGKLTIGYGRNLEDKGITKKTANILLDVDIEYFTRKLSEVFLIRHFLHFNSLPEHVQEVLVEMSFQIGVPGLMKFKKTIEFIKEGNYTRASTEMLYSKWAKQTPKRAQTLSKKMRGEF